MSTIKYISYFLPEEFISNTDIESRFSGWTADDILLKVGINKRHVCAKNELASDLAVKAIKKFFLESDICPHQVEYLFVCTQNPDYFTPSTACIVQNRVGLPTHCGAADINQGCSGYIYALSLAHGLLKAAMVNNVMLVTSTTMTKCISPDDRGLLSILGDAASVTFLEKSKNTKDPFFVFGSDGSGAKDLIIKNSGMNFDSNPPYLYMNGPNVFNFIIEAIPKAINQLLGKAKLTLDEIDFFVFHQANAYILEHLRRKLKIPKDKFLIFMENVGNTSSSSIPIVLHEAARKKMFKAGDTILLMGFGGGLSWAGAIWNWQ